MFLKWLLGLLKAPLANLVTELKTNRDANIAAIENVAGNGATTAEAAVAGFVANEVKKLNPLLASIITMAEPLLMGELTTLVAQGNGSVPALYDAGVAFLVHEENVI